MNLAEILVYTDIRQLHQIANHYGCECNPHSKNELITSLLSSLRHRQTITQEVEQLSKEETHFFLLLLLDKRTVMSLEDLLAKAGIVLESSKEKRQEEARRYIAAAMKRGWIFPAKSKTVGQYQIPLDIREPYLHGWLEKWRTEYELHANGPDAYRDEGTALCDDIMQFLQFLQQEPVPLTAEGGMYKRHQHQLFQFLHVKEETLQPQKWRFGYGLHFDLYPDRFSLLYDFCYYHRWIEESGAKVALTEAGYERLQHSYEDQHYHDLIRFWMRLYKRAIPNLPMLVQLIPLIASGGWVSQQTLMDTLLPWIKEFYYDSPADILVNRVCKMMVHLGLLRVGQDDNGQWLYTATYASQTWLRKYNGFTETTILLK
ncbi:hypothetical protein [Brevibacillus choshinensis]|uniref:Helicase XPB/Ssl2 N-terminal domain-containing protein n=1 Tax=Brevibacillus choshinensis TaxID=54911 RepID=A0ABX7FVZ1_BRECH|nr:hypothetical protein [Brevibacillus choshinensis]QRG69929.1 hypothetical protein JNE38_12865 [Brevibacillus choshinensis]